MNIDDIEYPYEIADYGKSFVHKIFDMQEELKSKYLPIEQRNGLTIIHPPYNIDIMEVQLRIKDMFWRTTEEVAEALEQPIEFIGWKDNWKKEWNDNAQLRHLFEELADALHFFVEASIYSGLHPRESVLTDGMLITGSTHIYLERRIPRFNELQNLCASFVFRLGLVANTLKNKPWKQTQMITDKKNFYDLLLDSWIRFIRIWRYLGCDLKFIYWVYSKKYEVNKFRQRSNY